MYYHQKYLTYFYFIRFEYNYLDRLNHYKEDK